MNKYKNNVACSYGKELISVDDKFGKPFNSYLSADDVYNFKYLSQEFDSNVLDLVNQKVFHPYVYMSEFEKFQGLLLSKEKFYSLVTGKKLVAKNIDMIFKFEINLKRRRWKMITNCT